MSTTDGPWCGRDVRGLSDLSSLAHIDPDAADGPIAVYGVSAPKLELQWHAHARSELVYVAEGVITCEASDDRLLVTSACAAWIPAAVPHLIRSAARVQGYGVFVRDDVRDLPVRCCMLEVTPLLRELLVRAAQRNPMQSDDRSARHLEGLLLSEIASSKVKRSPVPLPFDRRLRALTDAIAADPGDRGTAARWAARAGLSERSLARLMRKETGMSFGAWRRQLVLAMAVERLLDGKGIHEVAIDLGYDSAGSFAAMFRRVLGEPPMRYVDRIRQAVRDADAQGAVDAVETRV